MYNSAFLCVILVTGLPLAYSRKDYTGYKLVDVTVSSQEDVYLLKRLDNKYSEVNELKVSSHPGDKARFSIPPGDLDQFCQDVVANNLQCVIVSDNLQADIDKERSSVMFKHVMSGVSQFDLFSYNRHPQINAYLDTLVEKCHVKGLKCKVITIGTSYEGRELKVIKIGSGGKKPGIWIDAGIHAREWIAPSTAVIIANRLIYGYDDPETAEVVNAFNWYILPSANPDGYEYSWDTDRFWRKTVTPNSGSDCNGTDPNRNWDFHWAEAGTSPDPCSQVYPGPNAFSEGEVIAMADFLKKHDEILLYLSLHAYSQLWLTPWSYTDELVPDNYTRMYELGAAAANKIQSLYNRRYEVGQVSRLLYAASGSSMDWALNSSIKYALTAELRDTGEHGFILPLDQVKPVGRETWLGIREMAKLVKQWELD